MVHRPEQVCKSEDDKPSRWWDNADLGFILLLLCIPFVAYGCSQSSRINAQTEAYSACVKAKDLTPQCQIILKKD